MMRTVTDKKSKELIIRPETIYKDGLNDGDTADLHGDVHMRRTSRKPFSRSLPRERYLVALKNEYESLVRMSNNEDDEITAEVIPFVAATVSPSNSGLQPFGITLEPQSLLTTTVQEDLQRKHWELRFLNIIYHVTPALNWQQNRNFIGSNSNLAAEQEIAQCGVAPEFSPCISISQANIQFEQCCRNKLLPSSCQHSCRYDVKESEVSTTIDAGLCSVLHIIPIVQCASNGRDNSECCRYKQVTIKSAPQCEIFCRSGKEIARVGLEHLVCRNVMNEIIACHLSGLRN